MCWVFFSDYESGPGRWTELRARLESMAYYVTRRNLRSLNGANHESPSPPSAIFPHRLAHLGAGLPPELVYGVAGLRDYLAVGQVERDTPQMEGVSKAS